MTTIKTYAVSAEAASRAFVDKAGYEKMYKRSIEDNEGFWAEQAKRIDWIKPFTKVKDVSWAKDDVHIRWYYDGTLNVCYNCVDRHLDTKGDDVAIIWEGDDPARDLTITYRELHSRVCKFANSLKKLGAKIETRRRFTDHHRYTEKELLDFINRCINRDVDMIVTTEKDFVRFPHLPRMDVPIYFMRVEIEILSNQETWAECVNRICKPRPIVPARRFF